MIDRGIVIDHTISNGELPHGYIQFHYNGTKEEAERYRQQLLNGLKALDHTTRLVHEIVNLKADIEKLIEKHESWETQIGTNELRRLLEKK